MSWLEGAGHRIDAIPTSEKKLRMQCQCGWNQGCLNRSENYWRNQHKRRVLRSWE